MKAPNGNTSYLETFYEIVAFITNAENSYEDNKIKRIAYEEGTGALYETAKNWTDEFEEFYKDREWDGEFFEYIENFCNDKNEIR